MMRIRLQMETSPGRPQIGNHLGLAGGLLPFFEWPVDKTQVTFLEVAVAVLDD